MNNWKRYTILLALLALLAVGGGERCWRRRAAATPLTGARWTAVAVPCPAAATRWRAQSGSQMRLRSAAAVTRWAAVFGKAAAAAVTFIYR